MFKLLDAAETETIKKRLLERDNGDYKAAQQTVDEILADVRARGDEAVFAYTKKFDRFDVDAESLPVTEQEIKEAFGRVDNELVEVMKRSAANITAFHNRQRRENWMIDAGDGAVTGQIYTPVEYAGVYVPGGKAAYPSSVLMNIIPAKCAGVGNICVATPAVDGRVNDATLVAASIAGAHKIFKIGGAQAIAAFAYGTQSIPKMDVIVGPGNIYVALAKKSIYGQAGIDMIAGPSEVLVIADRFANVRFVAADFISQAEHDELAACILVTDSREFAQEVGREVERQVETLERKEIIKKSLANFGTAIICGDMGQCVDIANMIAPEHLEICTQEPMELFPSIRNAGSIFLGEYSPEPLGDYFAGTNHVLPTNGTARFSSPLNVDDFQKKSGVIYYSREALEKVYRDVEAFADAEGLTAHAKSASIRFE